MLITDVSPEVSRTRKARIHLRDKMQHRAGVLGFQAERGLALRRHGLELLRSGSRTRPRCIYESSPPGARHQYPRPVIREPSSEKSSSRTPPARSVERLQPRMTRSLGLEALDREFHGAFEASSPRVAPCAPTFPRPDAAPSWRSLINRMSDATSMIRRERSSPTERESTLPPCGRISTTSEFLAVEDLLQWHGHGTLVGAAVDLEWGKGGGLGGVRLLFSRDRAVPGARLDP